MSLAKTLAVAIILIGLFVIRLMKYRAKWRAERMDKVNELR